VSARHNKLTPVETPRVEEPARGRWDGNGRAGEGLETCPACFGTGMEVVAGKGARRCLCRTMEARTRLFEAAQIPKRYRDCSLSTYRPADRNGSQLRAFNYAHRLVCDYPAVDRGLLFMGPCGVGKTHLAAAILRGLLEKGIDCLFYELGSLLRKVQGSYGPDCRLSESEVLAPLYEAEVLVLDELGASKPTDWVRETTMQIVNARYNERRLTIFTTNYLDEGRGVGDETLAERVGVRLRSRLYEMCRTVVVEGADYRRGFDG
jgi:DNA replication protein DnaC